MGKLNSFQKQSMQPQKVWSIVLATALISLMTSRLNEVYVLTQKPDGPTRTRTPTQLINYLSLTNGTAADGDQDY